MKVIERLVGMQAQWPPAPYVGIWTRTTGFRRETLERELVRGAVVKATVMRQTLHLVTARDYALFRAAMSETNFPWETALAKRLAPVVRKLGASGPVRADDAAAILAKHDLGGLAPRRAFRFARAAAHLVHHHETALWHARPEGRFVTVDEPEAFGAFYQRHVGAVLAFFRRRFDVGQSGQELIDGRCLPGEGQARVLERCVGFLDLLFAAG